MLFDEFHASEYERRHKARKERILDNVEQVALLLSIFAVYLVGSSIAYPF